MNGLLPVTNMNDLLPVTNMNGLLPVTNMNGLLPVTNGVLPVTNRACLCLLLVFELMFISFFTFISHC